MPRTDNTKYDIQLCFFLGVVSAYLPKRKEKKKKKYYLFIKHSSGLPLPLDIYSKCHFWYSALFKGNKNSKKPLLGGKRTTGEFKHNFFAQLLQMHALEHITAETAAEGESLQNHSASHLIWTRMGGVRREGIKKKVTEFVSECVIVRVCVLHTHPDRPDGIL